MPKFLDNVTFYNRSGTLIDVDSKFTFLSNQIQNKKLYQHIIQGYNTSAHFYLSLYNSSADQFYFSSLWRYLDKNGHVKVAATGYVQILMPSTEFCPIMNIYYYGPDTIRADYSANTSFSSIDFSPSSSTISDSVYQVL